MIQSEYGWLIEARNSEPSQPSYFAGLHFSDDKEGDRIVFIWTEKHLEAVRFARREDAEKVAGNFGHRIAEHAWDEFKFRRTKQLKECNQSERDKIRNEMAPMDYFGNYQTQKRPDFRFW